MMIYQNCVNVEMKETVYLMLMKIVYMSGWMNMTWWAHVEGTEMQQQLWDARIWYRWVIQH